MEPEKRIDADREVQRANQEARERKILTKKAAVQTSLISTTAAADEAEGPQTPTEKCLSKNARRRREKKAKQRQAEQRRTEEKQQRADDEFRKVLKAVEPLRHASGSHVRAATELYGDFANRATSAPRHGRSGARAASRGLAVDPSGRSQAQRGARL